MDQAIAALSFKGVGKTYRRSHLGRTYLSRGVEGLDLDIARGEAFGLLGLNGSGKTTTFKLALGLLRPTMGEVSTLGLPPFSPQALSRVGFLPELPYFYPFLTPEESLIFYGRLSGLDPAGLKRRVAEALELVGLSSHSRRRIAELSKGTVQRLGLAQAVIHDPELIILDEPVSGLDPLAIRDFRDMLQRLSDRGKTLVISSHSISELEKLCHRVGILKDGRLARLLTQQDWRSAPGGLEDLFVETVK
ncbi:MAG: ABC transporter ATP-binding protein [Elusimicrobia bacterium]|nr:ABC transporter ATP-binding protein [Elusimicrobiota bacterium]